MAELIYIRSGEGKLEPVKEEPFDSEPTLQALIAEMPDLLDGEQITPDSPRRWILVKREQGIPNMPGGGHWWAVDHLLIDQDAVPTLVEVKRRSNPDIPRKFVGQMLEYAAHTPYWTTSELRQTFERSNPDYESVLSHLLQEEDGREPDADEFWDKVATNLNTRRMRLLFVADEIPDTLARTVEFLNAQMRDNIQVLAVEIKQFSGQSIEAFVPRVIGRTAATPTKAAAPTRVGNPLLTPDEFLEQFSDRERELVEQLLKVANKYKAMIGPGAKGVSIRGSSPLSVGPVSIAWLYPPSLQRRGGWSGTWGFSFGHPKKLSSDRLQDCLGQWSDQFREDDFIEDRIDTTNLIAYVIKNDEAANHIETLATRLDNVLSDLQALTD